MNIVCPSCQVASPLDFVVDDGAIEVHCAACGATHRAAPRPPSPAADHAGVDGGEAAAPPPPLSACPKCERPFAGGAACPSCGLSAERFAAFSAAQPDDEAVLQAWARLSEHWDDPLAHDAFLEVCALRREFTLGAKRYRAVLRERPRDEAAARGLTRLSRMVEATLTAQASRRELEAERAEPFRGVVIMLIFSVFLAAVGVLYAWFRSTSTGEGEGETRPRNPPASSQR